ncbi:hypothetical protein [Sphingomonas sp. PAMC 26617]|uniref:hypothetical protein n=1 Tax=Sphingomonas sp. PAMC 26617 TaxID=1112216 RepID=UPI0012F495AC|nr:hypothetical protein [Sphingomonas sp. PAMC 26617]
MPDLPRPIAILPCTGLKAAEQGWNRRGFRRPRDQAFDEYCMLTDQAGAEVHRARTAPDWLVPGRLIDPATDGTRSIEDARGID